MKTAVEWLVETFKITNVDLSYHKLIIEQAKEMERGQIVKHSVELTRIIISNPFETSGKTPTELMDNYFNKTFKEQKNENTK